MLCRFSRASLVGLGFCLGCNLAHAQPTSTLPATEETESILELGPETEALRVLREMQDEMARIAAQSEDSGIEVPALPGGDPATLSPLSELTLPDLPIRDDERLRSWLDFYRNDPRGRNILSSWFRRIDLYSEIMERTLRSEGLPADLIYLSMIESGFNPRARSDAGAVGLWQLMPDVATSYGLAVDHWIDERMDPEASTRAGARNLKDLHDRLGAWDLTFAAYNMGYSALLRSIRKYNTNDYWTLARLEAGLPYETSFYVAKIMACAVVGRNRAQFGYSGVTSTERLQFESVEVPAGTSLASIARIANVELQTLRQLNPELLRDRTPPGSSPRAVRIPLVAAPNFRAALAARPLPLVPAYLVRFGDTLEDIAREYAATPNEILRLNEMDRSALEPGLFVLVPSGPRGSGASDEETVVAVPPTNFEYPDRERIFYRVIEGDQTREVASFFRVTVDELRRWNALSTSARLHRGMYLQLFVPPQARERLSRARYLRADEVRLLVSGSPEFLAYHEALRGRRRVTYDVQAGDTLTSLSHRFDLSIGSIARINAFPTDTRLRQGQSIILYVPEEASSTLSGADSPSDEVGRTPTNDARADSDASPAPAPEETTPEGVVLPAADTAAPSAEGRTTR